MVYVKGDNVSGDPSAPVAIPWWQMMAETNSNLFKQMQGVSISRNWEIQWWSQFQPRLDSKGPRKPPEQTIEAKNKFACLGPDLCRNGKELSFSIKRHLDFSSRFAPSMLIDLG